jgi:hypothetical protein
MTAFTFLFKDLDKIGSRKQYFAGFVTTDALALHVGMRRDLCAGDCTVTLARQTRAQSLLVPNASTTPTNLACRAHRPRLTLHWVSPLTLHGPTRPLTQLLGVASRARCALLT